MLIEHCRKKFRPGWNILPERSLKKESDMKLTNEEVASEVKEHVAAILEKQKAKGVAYQWGVKEHVALIRDLAVSLGFPDDNIDAFVSVLLYKGVGGNAAQFRQIKQLADVLPKKVDVATDLGY